MTVCLSLLGSKNAFMAEEVKKATCQTASRERYKGATVEKGTARLTVQQ